MAEGGLGGSQLFRPTLRGRRAEKLAAAEAAFRHFAKDENGMPDYRRNRIPGGSYFFTVNLLDRRSRLLVDNIGLLRESVRRVREKRPFHIDAWVVLPDHMHCVWTLPVADTSYSDRWKAIKVLFARSLPKTEWVSEVRQRRGERGIWQRRFWEHTIRDEADYIAHVDYVHLNPIKHGLVTELRAWPYSSFHRYVAVGIYPEDWLTKQDEMTVGERAG